MDAPINGITQLLGIAFISALVIERALQILKVLFNYIEARCPRPDYWNMRAAALTRSYLNAKRSAPDVADFVGRRYLFQRTGSDSDRQSLVVDANHVRQLATRGRFKAIGVVLGIIVAFALNLNLIDLVANAQYGAPDKLGSFTCQTGGDFCALLHSMRDIVGKLIMGISIGLGATPLNEMITRLESAYKTAKVVKGV